MKMNRHTTLKLAPITILMVFFVYFFNLADGWEILIFTVLAFLSFNFLLLFVQYVYDQKSFSSSIKSDNADRDGEQ